MDPEIWDDLGMYKPASERQWIDTHVHAWNQALLPRPWLAESTDLPAVADVPGRDEQTRARVSGMLLVEAGVPSSAAGDELDWMLGLGRATHGILGVVGGSDWRAPEHLHRLSGTPGLVGVRFTLRGASATRADATALGEALAAARESGLAVDILTSPLELPLLLAGLEGAAHGEVIIDHMGNPEPDDSWSSASTALWTSTISQLGAIPRVTAKLSGLPAPGRWQRHIEFVLETFAATSIVLGSDWPVSATGALYGQWMLELIESLGPAVTHDLLSGTATRVYGL